MYVHHKWKSHDRYGSQDSATDRFFLSSWAIFCPTKIQIPKKWKKHLVISSFLILHKCTKNHDHRLHCSWDMARDRCNCSFLFWTIFCLFTKPPSSLPLLTAQKNLKCQKNSKNAWSYHPFTQLYQNTWSHAILGLRDRKNKGVGRLHASSRNSETIDVWKVARHPPSTHVVACDDYSF